MDGDHVIRVYCGVISAKQRRFGEDLQRNTSMFLNVATSWKAGCEKCSLAEIEMAPLCNDNVQRIRLLSNELGLGKVRSHDKYPYVVAVAPLTSPPPPSFIHTIRVDLIRTYCTESQGLFMFLDIFFLLWQNASQ